MGDSPAFEAARRAMEMVGRGDDTNPLVILLAAEEALEPIRKWRDQYRVYGGTCEVSAHEWSMLDQLLEGKS